MFSKTTEPSISPIFAEIYPTKQPSAFDGLTTTVTTLIYQQVNEIHYNQHKHRWKNDLLWAIILGAVLVLLMSFSLAANSVANAISTTVGSKTLSLKHGLLLSICSQLCAFIYVSLTGSQTELHFILRLTSYDKHRTRLLLGQVAMISGLVVWLLFALYKKMPVSTGHSVVGATIGFSIVLNGFHGIQWHKIISVTLSWIVSPMLSGIISLVVFSLIDKFILKKEDDIEYMHKALPLLYALSTCVNSFAIIQITVRDFGLYTVPLHLSFLSSITVGGIVGLLAMFFLSPMLQSHIDQIEVEKQKAVRLSRNPPTMRINRFKVKKIAESAKPRRFKLTIDGKTQIFNRVRKTGAQKVRCALTLFVNKYFHIVDREHQFAIEYQFGSVLLFTSGFVSFLQSVHNLRQSVVPLAILLMVYKNESINDVAPPSPLLLCYVLPAICLGIYLCGGRVTETLGEKLSNLFPVNAFVAQFGTTLTMILAHPFGVPVSITYCLVGSIMAVGLVDRHENSIDWAATKQVIIYWMITLPSTALLVALFSYCLHFAL